MAPRKTLKPAWKALNGNDWTPLWDLAAATVSPGDEDALTIVVGQRKLKQRQLQHNSSLREL